MATLKKYLIKLGLAGLTALALVEKGRNLVAMLTGNATYITLAPKLPAIALACDALEAASKHVLFFGGRIAYDDKREKEKELRTLIVDLAQEVQVLSGGSKANILSAGFEVRKSAEPVTHLDQPQDLRARLTGYVGRVALDWEVVRGTRYYEVWMVMGDPITGTWQQVGTSGKSRFVVENLVPGTYYSFRVNAVGARTESIFSDLATLMAA